MTSLTITGDTSGSVTLSAPAAAGSNTISLPTLGGTMMASGSMPAFSAYATGTQSISNGTITKIQYNTEEWDTNSCYDNATNYRFTPNVAGYYQVNAATSWAGGTGVVYTSIYKNGAQNKTTQVGIIGSIVNITGVSATVYLNGSSDYIEIYVYQNTGGSLNMSPSPDRAIFQASMVRAA